MNAPPAFQFYPDDFIGGTVDLSPEDCGAYIRLLCYQWGRGQIPGDRVAIARVCGCQPSQDVLAKFPDRKNARLERERQKQIEYKASQSNSGKVGAEKRWGRHSEPIVSPMANGMAKNSSPSPSPSPSPVSNSVSNKNGIYSPASRIALHWLNEKSGKRFRETETSLAPINARLSEPDVDIEGVKMMIERQCKLWAGTKMQEYLTPTTLFGKEKFSNYYANREQPIILTDKPEKEKHHFII